MIVICITITFSLLFEIEIEIEIEIVIENETETVLVVPRKGWKRHPFSSFEWFWQQRYFLTKKIQRTA